MKPELKKYLNVHQYLQDYYQFRKAGDGQFSYDLWAKELGASDKSYVRMIIMGKRPINSKMAQALVGNMSLTSSEQEYFLTLIQYTQEKTPEHRELFGRKLIGLLKNDLTQMEVEDHYNFLSNPLLPRLQVLLSFHDLEQSPANLAWLLGCDENEIGPALKKLEELKLITKEENRFKPLKKSFKVPDNFGNLGLESFYLQNLDEARKAIQLPQEERRFKSLFLPLNAVEFQNFLSNLQNFVKEQLFQFNPDEYSDRRLYQVHFNIIPVSPQQRSSKS